MLFFLIDGSQHHHACSSDGRLVFPVQELEVLVERILHQIDRISYDIYQWGNLFTFHLF